MKKVIILFITGMLFVSCMNPYSSPVPIGDYEVIDTTSINKGNFGDIYSYDVIIKIDSTYFSAILTKDKKLYEINRKLNIK